MTRSQSQPQLRWSSLGGFGKKHRGLARFRSLLLVFRFLTLSALILALARPQTKDVSTRTVTNSGIDIVMAIDVSSSMLAQDLKPNRLNALKRVASDFIGNRISDRIGLVVYAGRAPGDGHPSLLLVRLFQGRQCGFHLLLLYYI